MVLISKADSGFIRMQSSYKKHNLFEVGVKYKKNIASNHHKCFQRYRFLRYRMFKIFSVG